MVNFDMALRRTRDDEILGWGQACCNALERFCMTFPKICSARSHGAHCCWLCVDATWGGRGGTLFKRRYSHVRMIDPYQPPLGSPT